MVVVMSCKWGMFPTLTGPSASRVAARIGSAAFLAPEMRISPSRGVPPVMMSLSMQDAPAVLAGRRGQGTFIHLRRTTKAPFTLQRKVQSEEYGCPKAMDSRLRGNDDTGACSSFPRRREPTGRFPDASNPRIQLHA